MELNKNFTQIPNSIIDDQNLSDSGFRLLCYIMRQPEGWKFHSRSTAKAMGFSPRFYHKLLNELEARGYISRDRERRSNGQLGCVSFKVTMFTESKHGDEIAKSGEAMFTLTKHSETKLSETKLSESKQLIILNNNNTNNNKTECEGGDKSPGHTQEDYKKFFISKAKEAQSAVGASDDIMIKFASYWMQRTEGGRMLWQTKRTFDFTNRLRLWIKNEIRPN